MTQTQNPTQPQPELQARLEARPQAPVSTLTHIPAPDGVAPGIGYTQVVTGTGRLVAVSGQVALDQYGSVVGRDDAAAQALQVFENLNRCLAAAGATFDDVIKLGYFVTDVTHLPAIRKVRDQYIDAERLPASTAVQVAALIRPELLMEIEALALIPDAAPNHSNHA